jgi:hypothetical protein
MCICKPKFKKSKRAKDSKSGVLFFSFPIPTPLLNVEKGKIGLLIKREEEKTG